jgi:hypothetical protein
MKTTSLNENEEVVEMLNEVRFFGIQDRISELGCMEICQNIGMTEDIEAIRAYMKERLDKDGNIKKNRTKIKLQNFSTFWNSLLAEMNIVDLNQTYNVKSLLYTNLMNLIMQSQLRELANINMRDSMLAMFCKYFKRFVIQRKKESLTELKLSFTLNLNISGLDNIINNAIPVATQVIGNAFNGLNEFKEFAGSLVDKFRGPSAGTATTTTPAPNITRPF